MAGSDQKTVLSKNVLQMKFMQRSVLRIEKEQNEEEKKRDIDDEHWVLDLPATQKLESKYIMEPSLMRIEGLQYGRMSYHGCNPEIEKLMKIHNTQIKLDEAAVKEKEMSVDEEEMANRYQTLFGTVAKKLSKKRDQSKIDDANKSSISEEKKQKFKKWKFLKPSDD